jgi:ADP-heptose:LPS heptosyltransferase
MKANPKTSSLISYFEFAGIEEKDYKPYLTNPKLSLGFEINNANKIFKKYAVIHIEDRAQASRNIIGIDWAKVASCLNEMGYNVIQLGKNLVEIEGVLNMNTVNENLSILCCG